MNKIFLSWFIFSVTITVGVIVVSCNDEDGDPETSGTPGSFMVTVLDIAGRSAVLQWEESMSSDSVGVSYSIFINGNLIANNLTKRTFTLKDLEPETNYSGVVTARNSVGSTESQFTFTTLEGGNEPPASFTISVDGTKPSSAEISWSTEDPEGGRLLFTISLNENVVASDRTQSSYFFDNLTPATTYNGTVVAEDPEGLTTVATFSFATSQNVNPSPIEVTVGEVTDNTAEIIWTPATDPDGDFITYTLTLDGMELTSGLQDSSFTITALQSGVIYEVVVGAFDGNGGLSQDVVTFTTGSNEPPSDFTVTVVSNDSTGVNISWTASVDPEGGLVTYNVVLDSMTVAEDLLERSFVFTQLAPDSTYAGNVIAIDPSGGQASASFDFTTPE